MQIAQSSWSKDQWSPSLPTELNSSSTLVLAFAARELKSQDQIWQELQQQFPDSVIAGCSTAGEIYQDQVLDGTVSLLALRFDHSTLKQAISTITHSTQSQACGQELGQQLYAPNLKHVLVFSDGLLVNGTELVQGLRDTLPNVSISGGLAGDAASFKETWTLAGDSLHSGQITAIGFYGSVQVQCASQGGWDTFGPQRKVTRSERNVLYELDGKPALAIYKEYLGEQAAQLPGSALLYPLALESEFLNRREIVRTVLAIDEDSQSLTFAGDIPEGSIARLMVANFDRLVDGASDAAQSLAETTGPTACIAISCVGRKLILGTRTEDETEATLESLNPNTLQTGFYSYGEISTNGLGTCDLHNQTMTLTLITEADV